MTLALVAVRAAVVRMVALAFHRELLELINAATSVVTASATASATIAAVAIADADGRKEGTGR